MLRIGRIELLLVLPQIRGTKVTMNHHVCETTTTALGFLLIDDLEARGFGFSFGSSFFWTFVFVLVFLKDLEPAQEGLWILDLVSWMFAFY